jgi:hypothetical protein
VSAKRDKDNPWFAFSYRHLFVRFVGDQVKKSVPVETDITVEDVEDIITAAKDLLAETAEPVEDVLDVLIYDLRQLRGDFE